MITSASLAISQLVATGGIVVNGGIAGSSPLQPLTITDDSPLPECQQTIPFSYSFNVTGGVSPYTWSLFSGTLQPGLSLSSAGVLSGTCSNNTGTATFVVKVQDSSSPALTQTKQFQQTATSPPLTLYVCDSGSTPQTCPDPPSPVVSETYYNYSFNVGGGAGPPYTWVVTVGSVPTGLTLSSSGILSGFPNTPGTYTFTVQVTDAGSNTATAAFTVQVTAQGTNPTIASEPTTWVNNHQGGVNASTGSACAQTDTNCTWQLPKTCNAANNCIHEQLGFGSNDHPASLAGLIAAGCDWSSANLSSYSGQTNWYLWVEVKNGANLKGGGVGDATQYVTIPVANGGGNTTVLYAAPVKISGQQDPMCSSAAIANPGTGYFRVTGQCSAGSGSGSPNTPGYPLGSNDTPCNNLADQPPCFHSITDSGFVNNPTCTNDLPSMFTILADAYPPNGGLLVYVASCIGTGASAHCGASNVSLSGMELAVAGGSNQSMTPAICNAFSLSICSTIGNSMRLVRLWCQHCGMDHFWAHGNDPGDPNQQAFAAANYPVTPSTTQHNCPTWAYFQAYPYGSNLTPIDLTTYGYPGTRSPYIGGCGDDLQTGIQLQCTDCWVMHGSVTKIHRWENESHAIDMNDGWCSAFDSLGDCTSSVGAGAGPLKLADLAISGASGSLFFGGDPIDPKIGAAHDIQVTRTRIWHDSGWRYLTGGAGHSPQFPNFGCSNGPSAKDSCPFTWAMKKNKEMKWGVRVLYDGFIWSGMWPDGQSGTMFDDNVRTCSGGSDCFIADSGNNPLTTIADVRYTNGIVRDAAAAYGQAVRSNGPGDGGGVSQGLSRVYMYNLLGYNFDAIEWGGSGGHDFFTYGAKGNTFFGCTATRTSNIATLTCPLQTVNPKPLSEIDVGASGKGVSGSAYINFQGQREDPYTGGTAQFSCDDGTNSCLCTVVNPDKSCGDPAGSAGQIFSYMIQHGMDCTKGLPCTPNATGIWAPACQATPPPTGINANGIGGTSELLGTACGNICGAGANQACPKFGCGDAGCSTGTDLTATPTQLCLGTGRKFGQCGVPSDTFQTWAFGVTNVLPGDIVEVTNCASPGQSFNTPTLPVPATQQVYACAAGKSGTFPDGGTWSCSGDTNPASLVVTYPNEGPNVSVAAQGCQLSNTGGYQKDFVVDHVAFYTGGTSDIAATPNGFTPQMLRSQLTNSIFYFGGASTFTGLRCASGAGCQNKEASAGAYSTWDPATFHLHHNAFLLPTAARAALYTAVGLSGSTICNSPAPTPGNCTEASNGSSYIPITPFCTTASQTLDANGVPQCLGLTGWLNTSVPAFPSSTYNASDCSDPIIANCPLESPPTGTFDYHNFSLCTSCQAGGKNFFGSSITQAGPATDSFQLGPCLTSAGVGCSNGSSGAMISIDKALTRTKYVCTGSCGSGPWPD